MTAPLLTARPFGGPAGGSWWSHDQPAPEPTSRRRVLVVGDPQWPHLGAVFASLTVAWREAGMPLVVVHEPGGHPLGGAVRLWLAEHPCGHRAVTRGPLLVRGAWRALACGEGPDVDVVRRAGVDVRTVQA